MTIADFIKHNNNGDFDNNLSYREGRWGTKENCALVKDLFVDYWCNDCNLYPKFKTIQKKLYSLCLSPLFDYKSLYDIQLAEVCPLYGTNFIRFFFVDNVTKKNVYVIDKLNKGCYDVEKACWNVFAYDKKGTETKIVSGGNWTDVKSKFFI